MPEELALNNGSENAITDLFATRYRALYGHLPPEVPLEIVNLRVKTSVVEDHRIALSDFVPERTDRKLPDARKGQRPVWFEGQFWQDTAIYDRYLLPVGETVSGPAVIEERETSIVVGPTGRFWLDKFGAIVISLGEATE